MVFGTLDEDGSFHHFITRDRRKVVIDRSQQSRQDYGADVGGFMVKDHLWFFGAYNRVTFNQSQILNAGAELDRTEPQSRERISPVRTRRRTSTPAS